MQQLLADVPEPLLIVFVERDGVEGLLLLAVAVVLATVGLDGVLQTAEQRRLGALQRRLGHQPEPRPHQSHVPALLDVPGNFRVH